MDKDPLFDAIIDAVIEAIAQISPEHGYRYNLAASSLKPGIGAQTSDGAVTVYMPAQDLAGDGPQQTQADTLWELNLGIEITAIAQNPKEDVSRRAWGMWAAVYYRLCTVGGITNAQAIWPSGQQCVPDDSAGMALMQCMFTIQYQHAANNPFSS
jgi:hypothetical protein